jgi:hypothetical protein
MSRVLPRPLAECTAGGLGRWAAGAAGAGEDSGAGTASTIRAAAASAPAASTVPAPDPVRWPPRGRKTVLRVSALVTCAGLSEGNCARMRATMPATTALAAVVLLIWA